MLPWQPPDNALLTVGHGTLEHKNLVALLHSAGVDLLVDVRRYPASRRHPNLAGPALASILPTTGIAYRWEERLGGRRHLPRSEPTLDPWWTVEWEAFRGYAAHTRSTEFQAALEGLVESQAGARVAAMCSESVWSRCHRRLIADVALAAHHIPVWHLMHQSRARLHQLAAGAGCARTENPCGIAHRRQVPRCRRHDRKPKTCDSTATVDDVRRLFTDDHVHSAIAGPPE